MVRQSSNINNNVPYLMSFVPHLFVFSFQIVVFHTLNRASQQQQPLYIAFILWCFTPFSFCLSFWQELYIAFILWCFTPRHSVIPSGKKLQVAFVL